jgi:fused signal recognition particle receptor
MLGWAKKLKEGLKKTSTKLTSGISDILTKKKLDEDTLLELEELLIVSDIGVETSAQIIKELAKNRFNKEITQDEVKEALAEIVEKILEKHTRVLEFNQNKPHIVLLCGVNGNGKTTTAGKIAAQEIKKGKKVMLGSCDTFRAAAHDQLSIWGERSGATVIGSEPGSDPASVAFKATEDSIKNKVDLLMLDTAGRVSNKKPLMDQLAKIDRVIKKLCPEAPHDTILVLDATSGQNATKQVEDFKQIVNLTGIIITKLDGSAKAGVVISIAQKFNIPIVAIGVGEQIDDLNAFSPKEFARNLLF